MDNFLGWVVIDVMFNVVDLGKFLFKDLLRKRGFQAFSTYTYSPNLVLFNNLEVGCCVLIAQPQAFLNFIELWIEAIPAMFILLNF